MVSFFNKHLNFIDYAIWNLKKKLLKTLFIFIIFSFCIFFISSVIMFTSSLKKEAKNILSDAPDIIIQKIIAGRHELIEKSVIDKVKNIKGVSDLKFRLWGYYFEPNVKVNFTLLVPFDDMPEKGKVILGNGVSKILKKSEKDFLPLIGPSKQTYLLEIDKVFEFSSAIVTNDLILLNEKDFREITNIPSNKFTDLALIVNNKNEVDKIAEKILNLVPNVRIITKKNILKTYDILFDWRSSLIILIFFIFFIVFLVISLDKKISDEEESKNEVGLLKALGWDTQDVIILKSWESIIISIFAFLLGVNLAYIHVFIMDAFLFKPVLMGWSVLYPQFNLVPYLNPWTFLIIFALTVAPFLLISIILVWRLSITDPDLAMR